MYQDTGAMLSGPRAWDVLVVPIDLETSSCLEKISLDLELVDVFQCSFLGEVSVREVLA